MLVLLTAAALQARADGQAERPGAILLDQATGKIAASGAEALARRSEAGSVHEFPDGFLFPALIDTHVHLVQAGDGMPGPELVEMPERQLVERSLHNAARALRAGVAVLEDQGGRGRVTLVAREEARADPLNYPRLLVAGPAITKPNGHMWYLDGQAADGPAIEMLARRLLAEGVDIIKLVASGGGTPGTVPHAAQYTADELARGVNAAHDAGRRATAHCNCTIAIDNAVTAGVDLIHHANFFDEQGVRRFDPHIAERIAASGTFVDPTLWVTASLLEALPAEVAAGSEQARKDLDRAQRHWDGKLGDVRRLHEAGVKMVAGSDGGYRLSQFGDTWREAMSLRDVAMPVREALSAATDRAAEALGLTDAGRLEIGYSADVLVLAGNPVDDMRHLGTPRAVYRLGHRLAGSAISR